MSKLHKIKGNFSSSFKKNINEAAQKMKPDQDVIEIPESSGQVLVRKDSQEEKEREDLIKTVKCTPIKYEGEEFWVCVR